MDALKIGTKVELTDIRQLTEWGEWMKSIGWTVAKLGNTQCLIYKLPIIGISIIKIQRYEGSINLDEWRSLKAKSSSIYSVFEPISERLVAGLPPGSKLMKEPYLPTRTRIVLLDSEKQIWANLSENAKRLIHKNEKTRTNEVDWKSFYENWCKWCPSVVYSRNSFESIAKTMQGKIKFYASGSNNEHSGIAEIYTQNGSHYFQTWTGPLGKKSGAHYLLVYEAIIRALKMNKMYFDFEGIFDERFPLKKWHGFSEFKRKFGGVEIEYPGAFSKWF